MRVSRVLLYCAAALLLASCVSAQATGRLAGSVVDSSGAVIPGARVSLVLKDTASAALTTTTTAEGLFSILGVPPGAYDVIVEAPSFRKHVSRDIAIAPGRETSLKEIRLEVGAVSETIEVVSTVQGVQTTNSEIALVVTRDQVRSLPVINRGPQAFVMSQAGVNTGRESPVINGQRTTFTNVTVDGINIQDNFIRTNAVNFSPFVLLLDQVAEFTVATSNTSAAQGGGASQVSFVTPSGTNRYRVSIFWQNRNNAFAANTWFNNQSRVARPFLNQNQAGGSIGGPIKRDKLFFYANYEAFRVRQQTAANRSILTADARQGLFTYVDTSGVRRQVNILQAAGVPLDAAAKAIVDRLPGADKINNFRVGDSTDGSLRNTAGYSFNIRNNRTQDHVTGKLDYNHSTKNTFSASYIWTTDIIDRPDTSNDFALVPKVVNDDVSKLFSGAWRWNPTPRITNELRGGMNHAPVIFATIEQFPNAIFAPAGGQFANPLNTFRTQGRNPETYNLMDNASYTRGKHSIQFGYQRQTILVEPFNDAGITPTYTLGIGTGNTGLTGAQLPGASATDSTAANNLLANLAGYVTTFTQTFNVKDRQSGFVAGSGNIRHWRNDNHSFYVTDAWKARQNVTLNLGVRYEYFTRVNERDGLALLPVLPSGNAITALLSNSTLDFSGSSVNRPFYNPDRNNFAPNVGLSWDVFGKGRTAIRAAYSVNFVNDELMVAMPGVANGNAGLGQAVTGQALTGRISTNLPGITTPRFAVPRTFADNYALSRTSAFSTFDPNLRTPYVQQWSLGVQHEWKGSIFDLRYVANHGTKLFRRYDINQVIVSNDFLADFQRARQNGNLARTATGVFNPAFSAAIPGSQPLTLLTLLPQGGQLTSAAIRNFIDQGQVGELANTYQVGNQHGSFNFFPNPFAQTATIMTNYSNSSFNSLQFEVRRQLRGNLQFQANYTFSKVLSDAASGSENAFQARNEAFLDLRSPSIERARAPFDITHNIKGNYIYRVPFGSGYRMSAKPINWLISGWTVSGIMSWQSGAPVSVLSGLGTLNRSGQSGNNTASSTLNKSQLDQIFQFRMTGNGPYYVAASVIGPDGRAVAADGSPAFSGQAFFQPAAGTVGALQRRMFSGPWAFSKDFAVFKSIKITESQSIELRMDASNIFNHPTFFVDNQTITSSTFGKITGTLTGRRVLQFSLHYKF